MKNMSMIRSYNWTFSRSGVFQTSKANIFPIHSLCFGVLALSVTKKDHEETKPFKRSDLSGREEGRTLAFEF